MFVTTGGQQFLIEFGLDPGFYFAIIASEDLHVCVVPLSPEHCNTQLQQSCQRRIKDSQCYLWSRVSTGKSSVGATMIRDSYIKALDAIRFVPCNPGNSILAIAFRTKVKCLSLHISVLHIKFFCRCHTAYDCKLLPAAIAWYLERLDKSRVANPQRL